MKTKWKKILTKINEDYVESRVYYTMYTLVFSILCVGVYWYFIRTGKSFVDTARDGLTQHYTFFAYYGRYLRNILYSVFVEHSLSSIPMFDYNIGFGDDIINTMSYYVMGDPFSFMSIFVSMNNAEIMYDAMIIFRIFMAGISFSLYCRYHNYCSMYTLVGTIIYVFSGTTLFSAIIHPYFTNPLIWLPLIFMAIDKILNKKGGKLQYIFMIALAALSNFYFFYMICLIIVIYTIYRYFMVHDKIILKETVHEILSFLIYSICGIGMSFVLFFPALVNILSISRVSEGADVKLLYEPYYYLKLTTSFMTSTIGIYYERMGYTALALIAVIVLVKRSLTKNADENYKYLRNAFFMLVIFLCIPYIGSLFNGMGYSTNRYIFAMDFVVSLIVTIILPKLFDLTNKEVRILVVVNLLLFACIMFFDCLRTNRNLIAVGSFGVVIAVLLSYRIKALNLCNKVIALLMVCAMILSNAFFTYSPSDDNLVKDFLEKNEAINEISTNTPASLVSKGENEGARFDTEGLPGKYRNTPMILGQKGTSLYYSTCSKSVSSIMSEMYLNNTYEFINENLQHRTYLDALMGVQYFVIKQGDNGNLPYGYDHLVKREKGYEVYTSRYTTGMAFTSDQWIDESTYEKMSVMQKQQALLQGVVTDNDNGLAHAELSFGDRECKYQIKNIKGLKIEGDTIRVTDPGAELELSFEGMEQSECYVVFDNLQYEGTRKADNYTKQQIAKLSYEEQREINNSKLYATPSSAVVSASADQAKCALTVYGKTSQFYSGKSNFLLNMGYSDTAKNKIKLTFQQRGIFTFDKLSVVCQPMSDYERDMKQRQKHVVEDIKLGTNCLDASVEAEKDSMLVLVLPYKAGWKATVNGKEAEIQRADGSFMAVKVTAGTNKVHLQYSNPYFVAGGVISIICWSGYLVAFAFDRRKKNKKVKGNTNE
ncbi:MAG: YfhO family protein [Lachnospiraceae bacterium]|nr:YfhO family protein [Lachnospiraceae bacterium]